MKRLGLEELDDDVDAPATSVRSAAAWNLEIWREKREAADFERLCARLHWRRWKKKHPEAARAVKRSSARRRRRAAFLERPPQACGSCGVLFCTVPSRRPSRFCSRACRARSYRLR